MRTGPPFRIRTSIAVFVVNLFLYGRCTVTWTVSVNWLFSLFFRSFCYSAGNQTKDHIL